MTAPKAMPAASAIRSAHSAERPGTNPWKTSIKPPKPSRAINNQARVQRDAGLLKVAAKARLVNATKWFNLSQPMSKPGGGTGISANTLMAAINSTKTARQARTPAVALAAARNRSLKGADRSVMGRAGIATAMLGFTTSRLQVSVNARNNKARPCESG